MEGTISAIIFGSLLSRADIKTGRPFSMVGSLLLVLPKSLRVVAWLVDMSMPSPTRKLGDVCMRGAVVTPSKLWICIEGCNILSGPDITKYVIDETYKIYRTEVRVLSM